MARPSPEPPAWLPWPRRQRLNSSDGSPAGNPAPKSRTATKTPARPRPACTSTRGGAPPWRAALSTRFATACASSPASARTGGKPAGALSLIEASGQRLRIRATAAPRMSSIDSHCKTTCACGCESLAICKMLSAISARSRASPSRFSSSVSRCAAVSWSPCDRRALALPTMPASGVRRSWDREASSVLRAASAFALCSDRAAAAEARSRSIANPACRVKASQCSARSGSTRSRGGIKNCAAPMEPLPAKGAHHSGRSGQSRDPAPRSFPLSTAQAADRRSNSALSGWPNGSSAPSSPRRKIAQGRPVAWLRKAAEARAIASRSPATDIVSLRPKSSDARARPSSASARRAPSDPRRALSPSDSASRASRIHQYSAPFTAREPRGGTKKKLSATTEKTADRAAGPGGSVDADVTTAAM